VAFAVARDGQPVRDGPPVSLFECDLR
jgi:hypothetical protein